MQVLERCLKKPCNYSNICCLQNTQKEQKVITRSDSDFDFELCVYFICLYRFVGLWKMLVL